MTGAGAALFLSGAGADPIGSEPESVSGPWASETLFIIKKILLIKK